MEHFGNGQLNRAPLNKNFSKDSPRTLEKEQPIEEVYLINGNSIKYFFQKHEAQIISPF